MSTNRALLEDDYNGITPRSMRLFVATDLPQATTAVLQTLQPEAGKYIRLVKPERMHLTLNFVGDADAERVADALQAVKSSSIRLSLDRVGVFESSAGQVLWVGVRENSRLEDLQKKITDSLRRAHIPSDTRPFLPHITLARCRVQADPAVASHFLKQAVSANLHFTLNQFHLFNSAVKSAQPTYEVCATFPLA